MKGRQVDCARPHSVVKILVASGSQTVADFVHLFMSVRWPNLVSSHSPNADECIQALCREPPDIVVIHHAPPQLSCFDLIRSIRALTGIPIIVVSGDSDATSRVAALELGADDWVTRWQGPMEMVARAAAVVRRVSSSGGERPFIVCGNFLHMNSEDGKVLIRGKPIKLTRIEKNLLYELAKREGTPVSHEGLRRAAWGPCYEPDGDAVKKYVKRLRAKIEADPCHPTIIRTEQGQGYVFVCPR